MSLKDKLKALKFDHTDTIDGYNTLCDEDVEAIINLVDKELIGNNEYGNIGYTGEDMIDETTEEMYYRNQLRQEQRAKLKGVSDG